VDVFGMVADSRELNESFEGTRNWIAYALQNNPEVIIFLSISSPNQPDNWEQTAQQSLMKIDEDQKRELMMLRRRKMML
jgi:GTPase SAR1 family protein